MSDKTELLHEALLSAEAALADIGDADREPGDDVAWCEARAAEVLPEVRGALVAWNRRATIQPTAGEPVSWVRRHPDGTLAVEVSSWRPAPVAVAQADAVRDAKIPRENNDKLIDLARYWKLDGDWMTCKGCKRSLIASRDGEELVHNDGCKFAAQQHPWAQLRALIAPSTTKEPAK